MIRLYLAFKPFLSPLSQTSFRTENIKFIHTACFSCNGLSSYKFSTNLASHVNPLNKQVGLNYNINTISKAEW